jgi:hypothetical protein
MRLHSLLLRPGRPALRPGVLLQVLIGIAAIRPVIAQEPINADSATQPSPGHVIIKEQFRFLSLDADSGPRDRRGQTRDYVLQNSIAAGLTSDLSLIVRTPLVARRRAFDLTDRVDREQGVGDVTTLLKWRFYRQDHGPLDTTRIALLGGAEVRTGDGPFTNDAYNAVLGLAATKIAGRHGFNGNLQWTFTTDGVRDPTYPGMSTADLFRYNGAYLYRLWPAKFDQHTSAGAWYAVAELNGAYETNGDNELLLSPGLMYEAAAWTLELSVQVPVWQDIANRPETEYALILGLRFSL